MLKCRKCGTENNEAGKLCSACGNVLTIGNDLPTATFGNKFTELPDSNLSTSHRFQLAPNDLIAGNYRIISQIGEGGMGVVYQAEDVRLKRIVALKFLRDFQFGSESSRLRLVQEARAAACLMHPNIAAVFELGTTDEFEFIVMEFVNGKTLKQEISERQLTITRIISIFEQICPGLSVAHAKGIIHRDIKSSNIMLSDDDQVKITDFGLATIPDGEWNGLTDSGKLVGTVAYMAPEQTSGEPASRLTDIWSVGVVLYEMLTGELPFNGRNWPAMIHAINSEKPKPISNFRPDVPQALTRIVEQLLEKNPSLRLPSLVNLDIASQLSMDKTASHNGGHSVTEADNSLPTVAVLPFANRSAEEEKEFFSAGLTDELISALTATNNLHVVARSSSFSFKDQDIDIRDIGRRLQVETIIEGSVRWSGKRLRINVQAVNVHTGYQIWSQVFDRELDDIFEIQEETALAIVQKLHGQLNSAEKQQLKQRPTKSIEAYEYYLQGMYFLNSMDPSLFEKGMELQKRAIAEDPDFQLAHVEIAEAYCRMAEWDIQPAREAYPNALKWANLALEISEACAETHACLGSIHTLYTWEWHKAESHLRRAIQLNPKLSMAHDRFAEYLRYTGHFDDAIAEARQARDLDPLAPSTNWTLAATLGFCGQPEQALPLAKKNVEMFSNLGFMYFLLAIIQESLDQNDEAEQTLRKGMEVAGAMPELICMLGFIYGKTERPELANECIEELTKLSATRYVNAFAFAIVYAGMKQADNMFHYLDLTYENRSWQIILLKILPLFDFAKDDPRSSEMLKKIGLDDS